MKLIDVSALKEWTENWFTKNRLYHPYAKNNNIPITELYYILEQMPSAQPEIVRCKDCKYKHIENMVWTCPFGLPGGENFFCGYGAEPYKGEQWQT